MKFCEQDEVLVLMVLKDLHLVPVGCWYIPASCFIKHGPVRRAHLHWNTQTCSVVIVLPCGLAGLLILVFPLDFEDRREYYLSVEGSRGSSSLTDVTTVFINITDVNDNPPVFQQSVYSAEIPEDLTPGSLVMIVRSKNK